MDEKELIRNQIAWNERFHRGCHYRRPDKYKNMLSAETLEFLTKIQNKELVRMIEESLNKRLDGDA